MLRTLLSRLLIAVLIPFASPIGLAWGQAKVDVPIEPMKIKMSHVGGLAYAALYVAHDRGYFKERGLDVELVLSRGGDTAFQVAGGTLNFAGGSPDSAFFNGFKRGMPLRAIASLAVTAMDKDSTPMIVRKDLWDSGAVVKVEQLKGRKVGNLVPGGITEYFTALSLKTGGLTIDDVNMISPMGFRLMLDGLTTKVIDACLLPEPFATLAIRNGTGAILETRSHFGEQILWIQTNQKFAKEHPNVVTNFLIGYLKGSRDITRLTFQDPGIVAILNKNTKTAPAIIKAAVPPIFPANGTMNLESIMAQQRYHMGRGKLTYKELIPQQEFIDPSFLKRAVAFLGSIEK